MTEHESDQNDQQHVDQQSLEDRKADAIANARALAELNANLPAIVMDPQAFNDELADLVQAERDAYRSAIEEMLQAHPGSRELVSEPAAG